MIYLIAGHSKARPGAIAYDGSTEHDHTTDLQNRIVSINNLYNIKTDDESMELQGVIRWINANLKKGDVICDIHFNNNNPAATGTEIFIHELSDPRTRYTADELVVGFSEIMSLRLRKTIQTRKYKYPKESFIGTLGIIERLLLNESVVPVFLLEICFLNERDMAKYIPKRDEIAQHILYVLGKTQNVITGLDPKKEKKI